MEIITFLSVCSTFYFFAKWQAERKSHEETKEVLTTISNDRDLQASFMADMCRFFSDARTRMGF